VKLEDEIKQKKFSSEYHKLVVNLLYTGSWIGFYHLQQLKPYGLTIQQYNILRILRGQYPNPATVNLLIERMLDKTSNASRIVDKLVNKKYATRKICPEDRRSVDVLITVKGLELIKEIEKIEEENQKIFKNLSENEMRSVNNLLDKLRG
jgi:DNA-binding MarR family transcriptional regulator